MGHARRGVPAKLAGWSVTQVDAGLWLSCAAGDVPPEVLALRAEPGMLSIIVGAAGPDQRTDELVDALFGLLENQTPDVRLVLSGAGDRYAAAARGRGINLVAADDIVVITPHGYALVRPGPRGPLGPSARPRGAGQVAQWRRYLASGEREAAGVLAPSPPWERDLPVDELTVAGVTVRRVPAGLAVVTGPGAVADSVWPDPDRVTIVVGQGEPAVLRHALAELLHRLRTSATDGVRLYWPRAGAGSSRSELLELARRCQTDLIAPVADLTVSGFGAVCHGPAGAAPWIRLTRAGEVDLAGSLYPTPAWELALADADLHGLASPACVEHIAAGLCVYRPGQVEAGLLTTARTLLPDQERLTMVVGGTAGNHEVRQDVEVVTERIRKAGVRRVLLLLAGAGSGGRDSLGQQLAGALDGEVVVPAGGWTATPDGRVIALPDYSARQRAAPSERWQVFSWRSDRSASSAPPSPPGPSAAPPSPPTPPAAPPDPPARPEEVSQPAAAGKPPDPPARGHGSTLSVAILPRDRGSSARDRQLYRESAARYQSHVVAVRRVLTQRPGLRAAAAGDAEDAVVTDFAAVLDFMADDREATTAALRAGSAGGDPRVACVISGFRRLPSFTGAVFTSAFLSGATPDIYVQGAFLVEPAFVLATSSHVVALDGDIDYVIWSQTGKRIAAFVADAARDEIVFPAGTMFRVLALYTPAERDERALAFLREAVVPAGAAQHARTGQPGEPFDEMDRRVLERLGAAATLRNGVRAEDRTLSRPSASGPLLVGFDARGVPFRAHDDG